MRQLYRDFPEQTKQYVIEYISGIHQMLIYPDEMNLLHLEEVEQPLPVENTDATAVVDMLINLVRALQPYRQEDAALALG